MSLFGRNKKQKTIKKKEAAAEGEGGDDAISEEGVEMTTKAGGSGDAGDDAGSVGEMKKGDYMIHIYIEKAKEIKVPDGGTVDPVFEISCLGQKVYS